MSKVRSSFEPGRLGGATRRGAKPFFLPPYSPDVNLIEQVFAELKTLLHKAAEPTVEATRRRIGQLLDAFTPSESANYLRNAGYASARCDQALGAPKTISIGGRMWFLGVIVASRGAQDGICWPRATFEKPPSRYFFRAIGKSLYCGTSGRP